MSPFTSSSTGTMVVVFSVVSYVVVSCLFMVVIANLQLTLIELESLRTIDIHELVVYIWEANSPGNVHTYLQWGRGKSWIRDEEPCVHAHTCVRIRIYSASELTLS